METWDLNPQMKGATAGAAVLERFVCSVGYSDYTSMWSLDRGQDWHPIQEYRQDYKPVQLQCSLYRAIALPAACRMRGATYSTKKIPLLKRGKEEIGLWPWPSFCCSLWGTNPLDPNGSCCTWSSTLQRLPLPEPQFLLCFCWVKAALHHPVLRAVL